jgi:transcription elongation factor Elf1
MKKKPLTKGENKMKQSTKPQRKAQSKKALNPNTPIYYSKVFEYDVECPHCHKKEVLKTTLPLQKVVKKVCRGCGKEYQIDISNLKDRRFEKFCNFIEGEVA